MLCLLVYFVFVGISEISFEVRSVSLRIWVSGCLDICCFYLGIVQNIIIDLWRDSELYRVVRKDKVMLCVYSVGVVDIAVSRVVYINRY